jgi:hypothetical protein
MLIDRHLGRFYIYMEAFDTDRPFVQSIFAEVIPVRVEMRLDLNALEVFAISSHFDAIDQGLLAPEYQAINDGGKVRFAQKRA